MEFRAPIDEFCRQVDATLQDVAKYIKLVDDKQATVHS